MKFEFISLFPVSPGKIIRGPAGVVLFCGGKEKIRPGFSVAGAGRCRFAPAMAMPGVAEKKVAIPTDFPYFQRQWHLVVLRGKLVLPHLSQVKNKQNWRNR
jgi:hypothetical protein